MSFNKNLRCKLIPRCQTGVRQVAHQQQLDINSTLMNLGSNSRDDDLGQFGYTQNMKAWICETPNVAGAQLS